MKQALDHAELIELEEHIFAIQKLKQEIQKHEQAINWLLELPMPEEKPQVEYPSMTKAALAKAVGSDPRTFRRALRPHQAQLEEMGIRRAAKILTPQAVKYLCEKGIIDLSDLQKNN